MKTNTPRGLADAFGVDYQTWRRWGRDFLDPDPKAGARTGHTRQYTEEDAITVYLAGLKMVNERKMSIPAAKKAIREIIRWLKENDFFPLTGYLGRVLTPEGPTSWELQIINAESGVIAVEAEGTFSIEPVADEENVFTKKYKVVQISQPLSLSETVTNVVHISLTAELNDFRMILGIPG